MGWSAPIRLSEFRIGDFRLRDVAAEVDQKLDGSLLGAPVLKLLHLEFGKGFLFTDAAAAAAARVARKKAASR